MPEKVVLIGAGSAMFTRGLTADFLQRDWDAQLALVDLQPEALAVAEGLTRKMLQARKSKVKLTASTDRRSVLKGATAVICTIGVGGRRAWEQDVFIPRKYGVFQPVGDSVMPGGASRSLRMIPAMVDIAKDILDLAPTALFFNYGNPMTTVCRGVRKATGANIIGLCHGVNHVGSYLAGVLDAPREAFQYTAVGLNHLTWFVEAGVRGGDAMPRLREIAGRRASASVDAAELGARFAEAGTAPGAEVARDNPFSWQLCALFGAFPAVLDRHVCEFFPQFFSTGKYYGKTLGVDCYSFEQTIAYGDREYDEMRKMALSSQPLSQDYFDKLGGEHEQALDILESIRGNDSRVYSVNLPNRGRVPELPEEAVLEGPALATGGTLRPVAVPPLSSGVAGILAGRLACAETIVDAALEGSREKFIQALLLDGSIRSLEAAAKLADELLAAQAAFLPQFKPGQPR